MTKLFVYLDAETIPAQDPAVRAEIDAKHAVPPLDTSGIKPAANLVDQAKIDADLARKLDKAVAEHEADKLKAAAAAEEEYRKTALDGTTGHLACVSLAFGPDPVDSIENEQLRFIDAGLPEIIGSPKLHAMTLEGERKLIEDLFNFLTNSVEMIAIDQAFEAWDRSNPRQLEDGRWQLDATPDGKFARFVADKAEYLKQEVPRYLQTPTMVCHHAAFDIRFIWQRAVILGVKVPDWWPIDARPWDTDKVDDTMLAWAGATGRVGLDRLCRALGIEGKPSSIDGSRVWDAVREGRFGDVVHYCDGDVERLRAIHRRIRAIDLVAEPSWPGNVGFAAAEREAFAAAEAAADAEHGVPVEGGAA